MSNNITLTIVNLNADCLFQIFAHLSPPDILTFRSLCSTLNTVVCKYLNRITKLAIVYTEFDNTEKLQTSRKRKLIDRKASFSARRLRLSIQSRIDETFKDLIQTHFRREDFVVISGRQKYESFLEFIKKYFPNIKKLALIVDPDPSNYPKISVAIDLLKLCPMVETLILDRVNRAPSGFNQIRYSDERFETSDSRHRILFKAGVLGRLFEMIAELSSLNELHFFSRRNSEISLVCFDRRVMDTPNNQPGMIGNFLSSMFQKLRVFSINHRGCDHGLVYLSKPSGKTFGDIQELGLEVRDCMRLVFAGTVFKYLRNLTLFGRHPNYDVNFGTEWKGESFEQLRALRFGEELYLTRKLMLNLKALPNLENLTADAINVLDDLRPTYNFQGLLENPYINRTIKYIQVTKVDRWRPNREPDDDDDKTYAFTDLFQRLQTVTVSRPEVENDKVYDFGIFYEIGIKSVTRELLRRIRR